MRRIIVFLTNVMFAGHILFGCCLHHAHVCEAEEETAHGDCGHHHGCSHHHDAPPTDTQQRGTHDPADGDAPVAPCDHGRCSFVKCETLRVDLVSADVAWLPVFVAEIALPSRNNSLAAHDLSAASRPGDCPLHMLYCALLI